MPRLIAVGLTLALATFTTTLSLTKLPLHFDTGLFVVATALDLTQYTFTCHQTAKLTNRTLNTPLIDTYLEGTAENWTVLVDRWSDRIGALVIEIREFFLCATHSEGRKV